MSRSPAAVAIFILVSALGGQDAAAELLSKRPITIVIPFTPGASSDTFQRLIAKKVFEDTGQLFVVESRPGGGGAVGAVVVRQAAPDGYTLFQANSGTHAANVALFPSLPYDPVKDFQPITLMWSFPQLLVVPREGGPKSVRELIELADAKPGGLSFGSQGSGSTGHILGEMLKARTGKKMVHVPYRGAGPAGLDVATGRLDFFFVSYASILPFIQAGKVRTLAVNSAQRLKAIPDVPTMAELGFPGFELVAWFGLVGPAGMPQPVVDKLHGAFASAVRDPQIAKQLEEQGADAVSNTPEAFSAFIASETDRFGNLVKSLGIKPD
jgi:tripartite-type tricarboxylate transporter receptor subunit TctC